MAGFDPLRSESDAFRLLRWAVIVIAAIAVIVVVIKALM
jgi:CHASE3 domain sensor protein